MKKQQSLFIMLIIMISVAHFFKTRNASNSLYNTTSLQLIPLHR